VQQGKVQSGERVVLLLTGHTLKDSDYTIAYHRGDLLQPEEIGELRPEIEVTRRNAVELDASVDLVLRELERAAGR
jgi:threonine synthase